MENAGYTILSRQSGLVREMRIVANNIANAATTGYRSEGLIFSEYVRTSLGAQSVSMGHGNVRHTAEHQGALQLTGSPHDLAIEGDGFFLVQTPDGERLTRAGSFSANGTGDLVTADGYAVLDQGGAPIFVPPGADFAVSADGTISAGGAPIGQIALVRPMDSLSLKREDGVMFRSDGGFEPAEDTRILQGYLESSNVNAVHQLARMIEVQRAYELGQSFLDAEDERARQAMRTVFS